MPNMLDPKSFTSLEQTGVAVLHERISSDIMSIGSSLGAPVKDGNSNDTIRWISPTTNPISRNSLSARYGFDEFPFHTESAYWTIPPRYLLLYCENPGVGERPTGFFNVLITLPEVLIHLRESQYRIPRRIGSFLTRCVTSVKGTPCLRADSECMIPTIESRDPVRTILTKQARDLATWHTWKQGDLVIVDNWRVMHGRGSSSIADSDRRIARLLIA